MPRNRQEHGQRLRNQLREAREAWNEVRRKLPEVGVAVRGGMHLEFRSAPGFDLALRSLENRRAGVELLAVRNEGNVTVSTVYIPGGKEDFFLRKVEDYLTKETGEEHRPKNQRLVASIESVTLAMLRSFWTDAPRLFPGGDEAIWWEVWLRSAGPGPDAVDTFRALAGELGVRVGAQSLLFPERAVVLGFASAETMGFCIRSGLVAELRAPKESPEDYLRLHAAEQREWADDLQGRVQPPAEGAPAVCLLDTGVNRGHPLLRDHLPQEGMFAYDPAWGVADRRHGHGTEMAGLALYGDLAPLLASDAPVHLHNVLESVKILPDHGRNEPDLYGAITRDAVGQVETAAPDRRRSLCLAVASKDDRDDGRPSSWSAEIDQISSGVDDEERRLVLVAAGNLDREQYTAYPDSNDREGVHDPAQAWNALTVGGFTERWHLAHPDYAHYEVIAPPGGLSPCSSTSCDWESNWPVKPEIVMEAGNAARSPDGLPPDLLDELQLLTTNSDFRQELFAPIGETSAATAAAARYAARVWSEYPELWPETVRGLLVHSARWTDEMLRTPQDVRLRRFGYGAPDLDAALWSARDALTLVAQDTLQPFERGGSAPTLGSMNLYQLPWPTTALQALDDTVVELRITLSYFIEPSPGRRGWTSRYRYPSHGLRFALQRPEETLERFRRRVNKEAREEGQRQENVGRDEWQIGTWRNKGSIVSDFVKQPAVDVATRNGLAVYPIGGWWKDRAHLARWDRPARYALIVSIESPRTDIDIYTPVATLLQTAVPVVT